ncbi:MULTISPECIES: helix-turn-helix domain-containing protein [Aeromicrobium]|uniref:Helix-turn-helix domain-containing protein n=1 Tax=Aeromicrobium phoceense TaxID=2754045 RepID=A0A838XHY9_9ACTN|nr:MULTISPECIES: helix-turn-helix domain-containing protein [Aeromicrobium]MBA4608368.1 helix-turn-helix domain-containing protein [Aeromicrobium phoceense]
MAPQHQFLTANDVAETLKVDVRVVWGLLKSGELRGFQVGGRKMWRIEASALEDYIARQYERTARDTGVSAAREPQSIPTAD